MDKYKVNRLIWLFFMAATQTAALCAQETALGRFFDYEGKPPFVGERLEFSALGSDVLTSNGHGLRNELKRKVTQRRSMYQTNERLAGTISYQLSKGSKTIVAQYHEGNTETLFKLYVADIKDRRLDNGIANDGIFDIYAKIDDTNGKEILHPFLSIQGDGKFDFDLSVAEGTIHLTINGKTVSQKTKDAPGTYLKFGDYLQAQDAQTGQQEAHENIRDFYRLRGIVSDRIVFEDVKYERHE